MSEPVAPTSDALVRNCCRLGCGRLLVDSVALDQRLAKSCWLCAAHFPDRLDVQNVQHVLVTESVPNGSLHSPESPTQTSLLSSAAASSASTPAEGGQDIAAFKVPNTYCTTEAEDALSSTESPARSWARSRRKLNGSRGAWDLGWVDEQVQSV